MAIRKFKMTYVIYIMFLVDSTDWETLKTDQLNKQRARDIVALDDTGKDYTIGSFIFSLSTGKPLSQFWQVEGI